MYKVDLHTHSTLSPDGGVSIDGYRKAITSKKLDYIAVTDHNEIEFAVSLRDALGSCIIVGEEVMTKSGEVIGLYLSERIRPGMPLKDTVAAIKAQNGLVYIPHPFETIRNGISLDQLDSVVSQVDIIEGVNGRALLQNRSEDAVVYARINKICSVASSDAHGFKGLGRSYISVSKPVTRDNIMQELAKGNIYTKRPSARALLYPKYHKVRKKIKKK